MLNPLHNDRCRHGSVYHNNGLWQLEINRRLLLWRKNPSQCYDTVIVRRTKFQELWKGSYVNCCNIFYAEDFAAELVLCSTLHLFDLQIFFITMPQEARICRKGKILRWNKHVGQLADAVSVHCPQTNEKPRDKMRIRLGCSTTHGRPKLVPHWIPQFHQIFTSSASSKTKTDQKFSCVFVQTWRRAKAKLANNKS